MFSLIITIISIALVAALALATIYYGGSAFNKGSAGAKAAQLINEGQQINGAVSMYAADAAAAGTGASTDSVATLSPSYLAQLPADFSAASATLLTAGYVTGVTGAAGSAVCAVVNDAQHANITAPAAGTQVGIYGCDAANTFYYAL